MPTHLLKVQNFSDQIDFAGMAGHVWSSGSGTHGELTHLWIRISEDITWTVLDRDIQV
jgi:hypothetical protein